MAHSYSGMPTDFTQANLTPEYITALELGWPCGKALWAVVSTLGDCHTLLLACPAPPSLALEFPWSLGVLLRLWLCFLKVASVSVWHPVLLPCLLSHSCAKVAGALPTSA